MIDMLYRILVTPICFVSVCVYCGEGLSTAYGVTLAFDSADDASYAANPPAAWTGTNVSANENPAGNDNGGFGFDPWNFAGGYHDASLSPYGSSNHFIDGVDFASSSFNDLGSPAFGLTNSNQPFAGFTARATRSFNPLEIGQTLLLDFDSPLLQPLNSRDSAGYIIRLNSGKGPVIDNNPIPGVSERFGIATTSGFNGNRWYLTDADGTRNTGLPASGTSSGARFRFSLTGQESYSMNITRHSDGQLLYEESGMLSNFGKGKIDSLEITLFGNGSGGGTGSNATTGGREFFFNNLSVSSGSEGIAGDFNENGEIDGIDFLEWQRGNSPDPLSADDLADWQGAYAAANSGISTLTVPEPSEIWMFPVLFLFGTQLRYGQSF